MKQKREPHDSLQCVTVVLCREFHPATDTQVKFLLSGGASCWQFVLN